MKIETNKPVVAYHITQGATTFSYAVDARHAVSAHPNEWSLEPWTMEAADAARERLAAAGQPVAAAEPLSPEDQEALDEHNKAVAAAAERLQAYRDRKAAEVQELAQVAQDEAILASAPPRPDPTARRPFGRKGDPTPAEKAAMDKQAAKKADDERVAKEKANIDKGAGVQISS